MLMCISCKKATTEFTFTPAQPKAGEVVTFVNSSSDGETWLWRFGDHNVSGAKSPTHKYDAPGTYQVTLTVDNKDSRVCSHMITVIDTIPTFISDHDTLPIQVFEDVTFRSQVFNPKNDAIDYLWTIEPSQYTTVDSTGNKWQIYFTKAGNYTTTMRLTLNGVTTEVQHHYTINDRSLPALLLLDSDNNFHRQRLLFEEERAEEVTPLTYQEGRHILLTTQDTLQTINGQVFRLSELKQILPDMLGFRIAYGKVYYRTQEGLYLANLQGDYINPITDTPVTALYTDTYTGANRLYWATETGVYYMPLVDHPMNQFDRSKIALINNRNNITRLAVDTIKRLR